MPPKFGTSGLRGLVTDLTPALVAAYTRAYLAACPQEPGVHVGRDLRASSPDIAACVIDTLRAAGTDVTDCGALPTPALALRAMARGQGAIMVTGSHIPADRNGLKFYLPTGEIAKTHETAILAALETDFPTRPKGTLIEDPAAGGAYVDRYATAFGPDALEGLRVGVYQHSSVARDLMMDALSACGAIPVALARSEAFVPVDTEAVDPDTRARLAGWAHEHGLDAIASTDGDADRPMLTDATGEVIAGDTLGALTARMLGADRLCVPVSTNTRVDLMGLGEVTRTRIGSPYVIAAMEAQDGDAVGFEPSKVVGFEPNGGFLLGFRAQGPAGPLPPLMTRDCLLPILAPLAEARAQNTTLAALVAGLPARVTAADRLQEVATDKTQALIAALADDAEARAAFFQAGAPESGIDLTDGLRVTFQNGAIVHLRPSGNAPECRCYAEAGDADTARTLVETHLSALRTRLT